MEASNSQLLSFVQRNQLTDLHLLRHPSRDSSPPPTYVRGRRRIDFMFGTRRIAGYILAAGITAFNSIFSSDHRGLFVDLNLQDFLCGTPSALPSYQNRLLNTRRIQNVFTYRQHLKDYVQVHNLLTRSRQLSELIHSTPLNPNIQRLLDGLVEELTRSMLASEKKCDVVVRLPWSPALIHAKQRVRFWELWMSELRNKKDFSRPRESIIEAIGWDPPPIIPPTPTKAFIHKPLRLARATLHQTECKAIDLRDQFLADRAAYWAQLARTDVASIVKTMRHIEATNCIFDKFRHMLGKNHTGGGLSSIKIPIVNVSQEPTGAFEWVHDPDRITDLIIARFQAHFSQA